MLCQLVLSRGSRGFINVHCPRKSLIGPHGTSGVSVRDEAYGFRRSKETSYRVKASSSVQCCGHQPLSLRSALTIASSCIQCHKSVTRHVNAWVQLSSLAVSFPGSSFEAASCLAISISYQTMNTCAKAEGVCHSQYKGQTDCACEYALHTSKR